MNAFIVKGLTSCHGISINITFTAAALFHVLQKKEIQRREKSKRYLLKYAKFTKPVSGNINVLSSELCLYLL